MEIILLILGVSIGFVAGFFYQKSKINTNAFSDSDAIEIDELRNQLHEIDKQKTLLEERISNAVEKFKNQ